MVKQRFRTSALTKALQRGFFRLSLSGKRRGGRNASGGGGGGGGGGAWSANFRAVVGLAGVEDYNSMFPYLNLMKSSSRQWNNNVAWNDSRLDANGEPANQAGGATMTRIQWLEHDQMAPWQTVRTGTYVLKWSGAGDVAPQSISSTLTAAGRRTFTVTAGTTALTIIATGPSTNLRLCHADHEALLDAGTDLLNPDFVTWLPSWGTPHAYRFLDWQATNFSTVTNAADWCALTHVSWCRQNGCPPEIISEVARKTGDKNVWTLMPYLATDAAMVALFQRMKDWYNGTYLVLPEGINECWNYGFPGTGWAQTTYSTTIQIRDENGNAVSQGSADSNQRINSAYAHHSLRVWAAADSVFGSSRVRPIAGNQTGFPDFMGRFVNYFDTALYGGATVKSLLNARGNVVQTHYFSAGNSPAPSASGRTYKQMCIDNWGSLSDDTWINAWKADIDHTVTNYWAVNRSTFNSRGCTAPMLCYEGGNHDFIDFNDSGVVQYGVTASSTLVSFAVAGERNVFANGERAYVMTATIAAGVTGLNPAWVRQTGTNDLRLYATQGAYDADTGNTGAGALTLTPGSYTLTNYTKTLLSGAWTNFPGTVNTGDNSITLSAGDYAGFSQLDRVVAPNQTITAAGDNFGVGNYVRKISSNRMRLYPSLAAANADTGDTGSGAVTLNAGTYSLGNRTRHRATQDKIYSLLQGSRGSEIAAYIYAGFSGAGVLGKGMALFAGPEIMKRDDRARFTYCFSAPNRGMFNVANESPYLAYLQGLNAA